MAYRHKRETAATRTARATLVAAPFLLVAAVVAVVMGMSPPPTGTLDDTASAARSVAPTDRGSREPDAVSRSASRLAAARGRRSLEQLHDAYHRRATRAASRSASRSSRDAARAAAARAARRATRAAIRGAHAHLWTTAPLNLWTGSGGGARDVGLVDRGERVLVTGRRAGDRAELVVDGEARWVTAAYLSRERPAPPAPTSTPTPTPARPTPPPTPTPTPSGQQTPQPATTGLSTAPCPDSGVESGLTPSAVLVHRAVCHAFPQIHTYLGYDPHGEHASGKAIDIMTSDKALGDRIAAFLKAHASQLDLYDVIWWDRIWTPVRASEGWRDYGDHGSPTANHMDHVHVCTN